MGYFPSWDEPWKATAAETSLANLPPYVNVVIISFLVPNTTYSGGLTLEGTGLDFVTDASVVKESIALLKARNPQTKVLIGVGGGLYNTFFDKINFAGIAAFVKEFGLDGVDLDYEPPEMQCVKSNGDITCNTDAKYIDMVTKLRAALPRPLLLSVALESMGAYGIGAWATTMPQGPHAGGAIQMLRAVGDQLDLLNIMCYDTSTDLDPRQALDAYRYYYKGDIVIGVEVANEAWGGHVISLPEVDSIATHIKATGGNGMMLWALKKPADQGPTAVQISQRICTQFGLDRCDCGIFCPPL